MASVRMPKYDPERPEDYAAQMKYLYAVVERLNDPMIRINEEIAMRERLEATPRGRWFLALDRFRNEIKGQEGQTEKLAEWKKNNPNPEPLTAEDYGDKD